MSPEIQLLWVLVFATITVSVTEIVISFKANSLALRSDGLSVLLDCISYAGNLLSEYMKGKGSGDSTSRFKNRPK